MTRTAKESATSGIAEAIRIAGGQVALAQKLGCSQQNISRMHRRGWVPPKRVVEIEQITGVPRARLINPRLRNLVDLDEVQV